MGKQLITVGLVLLGLVLLVVSYLVPDSHGGSWSDEQEEKYQEVQTHWHELHERNASGRQPAGSEQERRQELEAATAAKEKMEQELSDAQNTAGRTARILFWTGLVFTALGLASYPVTRPRDA